MNIYSTAATLLAAADEAPTWSLKSAISNGQALLVLALGAIIVFTAIRAMLSHARSGDVGGTMNTAGVVLICVGMAALGAGTLALVYGAGVLSLFSGLWS